MKKHLSIYLSSLILISIFAKSINAEPIHEAARRGDIVEIQKELDKGISVDVMTKNGVIPLMRALNTETMRFLLSKGANVNHQDENGNTALHWVATEKNPDKLKLLLENGANPQLKNSFGQTPLFSANTKEVMEILIEQGLDVDLVDNAGATPLSYKANNVDKENILELLIAYGADVNGKGKQVPLIQAAMGSREKHIEVLINNGADVKATNERGQTALHFPYKLQSVKLLLSKGADINAVDNEGNTPLHNVHDPEITRFLIAQGADLKIKNKAGKTPWDIARLNQQKAEKRKLKEKSKKYKTLLTLLQ